MAGINHANNTEVNYRRKLRKDSIEVRTKHDLQEGTVKKMGTFLLKQRRRYCLSHAFMSLILKTISATNWQPCHSPPSLSLSLLTADSYQRAHTDSYTQSPGILKWLGSSHTSGQGQHLQ